MRLEYLPTFRLFSGGGGVNVSKYYRPICVFPKMVVELQKHPKMIIFSSMGVVGYHHFRKPPYMGIIWKALEAEPKRNPKAAKGDI